MTASQQAKSLGCKSVKQVADYIDKPASTLQRWHTDNPKLFTVVCIGVAHEINEVLK